MIRLKRRNTLWLTVLGGLIAFALLAGTASVAVQLALLSIFLVAMVASLVEIGPDHETLVEALRRAPVRQRISPQAKEAVERARGRGGYVGNSLIMLDLGIIASQTSATGMAMRRTRNISKDDDGMRPFVTLYVDPVESDRHARVRFEFTNQYGEDQYVHEMRVYLREGEMNIMADNHLPLAGNSDITGAGDWDLRVFIDGNLVGMQNLALSPSMLERRNRLTQNGQSMAPRSLASYDDDEMSYSIIEEEPEVITPSLQELLNKQVSSSQRRMDSDYDDRPQPRSAGSSQSQTRRRRS